MCCTLASGDSSTGSNEDLPRKRLGSRRRSCVMISSLGGSSMTKRVKEADGSKVNKRISARWHYSSMNHERGLLTVVERQLQNRIAGVVASIGRGKIITLTLTRNAVLEYKSF